MSSKEFDYLDDLLENTGLDFEAAAPAMEVLPHRNKPYLGGNETVNSVFSQFMPSNPKPIEPEISDKELDDMAEIETDWIITQLNCYVGLGKGAISGVIFNNEDRAELSRLSENGQSDSIEARELLERLQIQNNLNNDGLKNIDDNKKLLQKVIRLDLVKKRREGKLILPTTTEFLRKMVVSQLVQITGSNPKIFSIIGSRLVNFFKSKIGL